MRTSKLQDIQINDYYLDDYVVLAYCLVLLRI